MADSPFPLPSFLGIGQSLFNHALSESSAVDAHNRQIKFWNMQNDYNLPINQRKRMQQAGMNPIDNVQSHPAGELSSVPENQFAHKGTFDIVSQLEAFSHIEKMGSETDLLAQQFKNAIIEEAIKKGELFGVKLDNEQKQILLKYYDSKQSAELRKLLAEIDNTQASTKSINEKLPLEKDSLKASAEHHRSQTQLNNELAETERQMRDVRYDLAMAQTDDLRSQILTRAQQISINFAQLEVNRHLMKSQVKLNSANTDVARRELYESARTFDIRKTAMIISNSLGMAEAEATAYANECKQAWDNLLTGISSWDPEQIKNASQYMPTVIGNLLNSISLSGYLRLK